MVRRGSAVVRFAALAVLGVGVPAWAIVGYAEAIVAAEKAMAETANLVAEARNEQMSQVMADKIQNRILEASAKFREAYDGLNQEIGRLETNPGQNAKQLATLKEVRARADRAKADLKRLNGYGMNKSDLLTAARSGHLEKTLTSVSATLKDMSGKLEKTSQELASTGDEKVGLVSVDTLQLVEGKMKLYLRDASGKETELREGGQLRLMKLPVVIRASVLDEQKVRLSDQKEKGSLPGGTSFEDVTDMTDGHKFVYGNPNVGTSTWTAEEEYTWVMDKVGPTPERVRAFAQRSSDAATKPATGDLAEIHPASAVAQKLSFEVTGKSVKWHRRSKLKAGERSEDVVPKDNVAKARLVFSVFPQ